MKTTFETRISPGMCDMNGHLNVAFYAQFFDSACWAFLQEIGGQMDGENLGWADVQHTTRFLQEVSANKHAEVRSHVLKIGRSSLVTEHQLFIEDDSDPSAIIEMATVRFDLTDRKAVPLEAELRSTAEAFLAPFNDSD